MLKKPKKKPAKKQSKKNDHTHRRIRPQDKLCLRQYLKTNNLRRSAMDAYNITTPTVADIKGNRLLSSDRGKQYLLSLSQDLDVDVKDVLSQLNNLIMCNDDNATKIKAIQTWLRTMGALDIDKVKTSHVTVEHKVSQEIIDVRSRVFDDSRSEAVDGRKGAYNGR